MSQRSDPLDRELQRSRRFGRPLSVVRVAPRNRGQAALLVAALEADRREVDHVWAEGDDVFVLLPETDRTAARAFVERACRPLTGSLAGEPVIASFPADGLTRPALLAVLHGTATERVTPPPVRPRISRTTEAEIRREAGRAALVGALVGRGRDEDAAEDHRRRRRDAG